MNNCRKLVVIPIVLMLALSITACVNTVHEGNASLDRIATLAASIAKAEDVRDIKRLQKSFGYYLDKGMWTDLSEYFTTDAVASFPEGVFTGKDSIGKHLLSHVRGDEISQVGLGHGRLFDQMNIQPVVHIAASGELAHGRWRVMAMSGDYGAGPGTWTDGIYNVDYVKTHGIWKIANLQYHANYKSSYVEGWGGTTSVELEQSQTSAIQITATQIADNIAVNDIQQNNCQGFPDACIAKFHYENLGNADAANVWALPSVIPSITNENTTVVISELLDRAQLLADELEVENLQRIYGYYLDRRMWQELAELFAEDGSIEMAQRGIYQGKNRVREFLTLLGEEGLSYGELNDHFQLQTIVDVATDGMTAKARSREWNMQGRLNEFSRWSAGIYENTFVKVDGSWKIQSLHYYPTFITDYDLGWTVDAQPAPGMSSDLPPDLPPSEVYDIYPNAHIPAFHYLNPVTGKPTKYLESGDSSQRSIATNIARDNKPTKDFELVFIEDLVQGLSQTERLIQRVKDHHEIENLENAYGYYLDKNLWNDLANLFAIDGSMELAQRGVYQGRERVRDFLFTVFGNEGPVAGRLGNHLHMQPVIHVSDDGMTAKVRSRMMQQLSFSGRPSMGSAIYENELIKEQGAWKFKVSHAFNTWTARYAGGWQNAPVEPRVPGPSEKFPPDALPTVEFSMFPNIYQLPFHYQSYVP